MNRETLASQPNLYGTASQLLHHITAQELPAQILKRRRQYRSPATLKIDSIMGTMLDDLLPLGAPQEQ